MLKPISRLRSICKGDLNHNTNPTYSTHYGNQHSKYYSTSYTMILSRISKQVLHSIPVLSIFVLLGIISYNVGLFNTKLGFGIPLVEPDGEVYAAESTTSNNTSLIIDNGTATSSTAIVRNNVAYSSHTVQVKADNITAYSLTINGPVGLTGSTTITGAGNKTPANMANNTWGYAFAPNTTNNESTLSYQSFNGNNQTLNSSNPSVSNNSVDFTRKLVFAAKFSQDAAEGHYKANVKLNLTVTPKALITYSVTYNANGGSGTVPTTQSYTTSDTSTTMYAADGSGLTKSGYTLAGWATSSSATTATYAKGGVISLTSNDKTRNLYAVWTKVGSTWDTLVYMQDMTADVCKNATNGATKALIDSRDNNSYIVKKLSDGNCWMVSNMTLDLSVVDLTPSDSDVSTTYTKGKATKVTDAVNWSTGNAKAQWTPQVALNSSGASSGDGNGYQSSYGYYYSWCAATAGTCSAATSNTDASGSICSKGWKLPKSGTTLATNDFVTLMNLESANLTSVSIATYVTWPSKLNAGPPAYFALGGANWYLTGTINSSGLTNPGSLATYWSRTAEDGASAYTLYPQGSRLYPARNTYRYLGSPVRCIAYSS